MFSSTKTFCLLSLGLWCKIHILYEKLSTLKKGHLGIAEKKLKIQQGQKGRTPAFYRTRRHKGQINEIWIPQSLTKKSSLLKCA